MARTEMDVTTRVDEVRDFISRYQQGGRGGHISGEEALGHYDAIVPHLNPAEYERAAQAAFARMSPDQRLQVAHFLRQRAHQQDFNFPELSEANEELLRDATQLARVVTNLEMKQEGILRMFFVGGGAQGGLGSMGVVGKVGEPISGTLLFKAVIGGIAANALDELIRTRGTLEGRPAETP